MRPTTRLDTVVRLKERDEEKALKQVAAAADEAKRAREEAEFAIEATRTDPRMRASAAMWELQEVAQEQALRAAKAAEQKAKHCEQKETSAREVHMHARRNAEAVRRVAETKRDEIRMELKRQERKEADEIASVLFWR